MAIRDAQEPVRRQTGPEEPPVDIRSLCSTSRPYGPPTSSALPPDSPSRSRSREAGIDSTVDAQRPDRARPEGTARSACRKTLSGRRRAWFPAHRSALVTEPYPPHLVGPHDRSNCGEQPFNRFQQTRLTACIARRTAAAPRPVARPATDPVSCRSPPEASMVSSPHLTAATCTCWAPAASRFWTATPACSRSAPTGCSPPWPEAAGRTAWPATTANFSTGASARCSRLQPPPSHHRQLRHPNARVCAGGGPRLTQCEPAAVAPRRPDRGVVPNGLGYDAFVVRYSARASAGTCAMPSTITYLIFRS